MLVQFGVCTVNFLYGSNSLRLIVSILIFVLPLQCFTNNSLSDFVCMRCSSFSKESGRIK